MSNFVKVITANLSGTTVTPSFERWVNLEAVLEMIPITNLSAPFVQVAYIGPTGGPNMIMGTVEDVLLRDTD